MYSHFCFLVKENQTTISRKLARSALETFYSSLLFNVKNSRSRILLRMCWSKIDNKKETVGQHNAVMKFARAAVDAFYSSLLFNVNMLKNTHL